MSPFTGHPIETVRSNHILRLELNRELSVHAWNAR
jgi:hypothetical protein